MEVKSFSKGDAVHFGWATTKTNIGFFIGLLIVAALIQIIPDAIGSLVAEEVPFIAFIIIFASEVISMVITMGLIKIAIKFCDNEKGEFADLFSCFPLFFKYLFGSILYGLIILSGMILLIIPGIVWAIKFQFLPYFIIDKGLGPIKALKNSSAITTGVKWKLFVFELLLLGINLVGALCLLISLFATIPTALVATAFVYRKLLAQTKIIQ